VPVTNYVFTHYVFTHHVFTHYIFAYHVFTYYLFTHFLFMRHCSPSYLLRNQLFTDMIALLQAYLA
jgi:hypothetical protein